jgi:ParB-like chromosome segregation protein Spo0J
MQEFPSIRAKVNDLIPYARNSRTHSDEQVTQIAASIKEFGFTNPVLIDKDNGIIAGHGRVMAAKKLKLKEVPCIVADGWTEAQKKAYIIADNKLALNAGWDMPMLKLELQELDGLKFDLNLTGFSTGELTTIFYEPNFEAGTQDDQGKLDELSPKMVNCPYCGEDFDSRGREA